MSRAYIVQSKPNPIYVSQELITGRDYAVEPLPYGSGEYSRIDYPTGVVIPYEPYSDD